MIKTAFVIVGNEINATGARRVAAVAKKVVESLDIFIITDYNLRSVSSVLQKKENKYDISSNDIDIIAKHLASYDLVCFSSMTMTINIVYDIVEKLKEYNSDVFTLLGGVHAILYPNDAIEHFDAICVGEGEKPIKEFLEAFQEKRDFYVTQGLWFKLNTQIVKNQHILLHTNEELNEYHFGIDFTEFKLYDSKKKQFNKLSKWDYIKFNGLVYNHIWTLGCPYRCSYCSNSGFSKINKDYLKIRYSKPGVVVNEIERVVKNHPYISRIDFHDDNIITLPYDTLEEFCKLYKKQINLPFTILGINPNTIDREKLELFASHGMTKARMGIQSGSEKILDLYKRNTSLEKIKSGVDILADIQKRHHTLPPLYDIICDNPLETKDDIISSLRFFNNLARPFTSNIFSLRTLPGTELATHFEENNIKCADSSYVIKRPTLSNVLLMRISIRKMSNRKLEKHLLEVKGNEEQQKEYPKSLGFLNLLFLLKRSIYHFKKRDFAVVTGKYSYMILKFFFGKHVK